MLDSQGTVNIKDDVSGEHGKQRMDSQWVGITVFYTGWSEQEETMRTRYIDTPAGLVKMDLKPEEERDVREVFSGWSSYSDVFAMVLKKNKKELDPKHFNHNERKQFDQADLAEWRQWVLNQVVKRVEPHEEANISSKSIIAAPMRFSCA